MEPCGQIARRSIDPAQRHREAAFAAVAIQSSIGDLPLECFAEFTPVYDPGLTMTIQPKPARSVAQLQQRPG